MVEDKGVGKGSVTLKTVRCGLAGHSRPNKEEELEKLMCITKKTLD